MKCALALIALAACGGDDGNNAMVDAPRAQDAQDQATCLIPGAYGDLGTKTGTQGTMGGVTATVTLDMGPPRDAFFLKMVANKGVFAAGIAPGTYTISGVDADYNDCGLCVHIIADISTTTGPAKFYFAESGSVMLTSVNAPISGTVSNVMLREVDIGSGDFVPFGCSSSITSMTFSTM